MYKRNTSHWFKHWDFILLDFILIEAAFYVAYVVRNGDLTLQMDTFMRSIFIVLGLIDLVMGFLMETYRGVLRRGYWMEAKAVARHVIVVCAGVIVYLFVIKESAWLTVMEGGEHWFHTDEQMRFLNQWLRTKASE